MKVTLKDVADRAGVSTSAVSRAFTSGASVSDRTRKKVERAAEELGYRPNALASSLTTGRTKLIGLISNNFQNPYFLEVFDLFTRKLQDKGLRPLLINLSGETDPTNSVALLRQYSVDGVIVASSTLNPSFAKAFRDAGMPVVHAFGRSSAQANVHVVSVDNVNSGRLAAEALLQRGYRSIGFLGGPRSASSTMDRLAGFEQALEGTGVEFAATFAEGYSFEAGRLEMSRLLLEQPKASYFCGDDVLSIGALSAIEAAGLQVPGDIGLIGFNDMEMAGWQNIDLTTIRQPVDDIVASATELICAIMAQPDRTPETRLFPCKVVVRGTLGPLSS